MALKTIDVKIVSLVEGNDLRGNGTHLVNGSPLKPAIQLQIGLWLITLHLVFNPQVPGQGSSHFC